MTALAQTHFLVPPAPAAAPPAPAASPSRGLALVLRLEGAAAFAAAVAVFAHVGGSWIAFAALLLVPDLAMLFYLAGPRVGAAAYNLAHAYIAPLALAAAGLTLGAPMAISIGLIWLAHIGMDRALGYGLKGASGFSHTHLGRIGRSQ